MPKRSFLKTTLGSQRVNGPQTLLKPARKGFGSFDQLEMNWIQIFLPYSDLKS